MCGEKVCESFEAVGCQRQFILVYMCVSIHRCSCATTQNKKKGKNDSKKKKGGSLSKCQEARNVLSQEGSDGCCSNRSKRKEGKAHLLVIAPFPSLYSSLSLSNSSSSSSSNAFSSIIVVIFFTIEQHCLPVVTPPTRVSSLQLTRTSAVPVTRCCLSF